MLLVGNQSMLCLAHICIPSPPHVQLCSYTHICGSSVTTTLYIACSAVAVHTEFIRLCSFPKRYRTSSSYYCLPLLTCPPTTGQTRPLFLLQSLDPSSYSTIYSYSTPDADPNVAGGKPRSPPILFHVFKSNKSPNDNLELSATA